MFCVKCGKKLPETAKFCAYCGAANNISQRAMDEVNKRQSETESIYLPQLRSGSSPMNRIKWFAIFIGILLVLCLLAYSGIKSESSVTGGIASVLGLKDDSYEAKLAGGWLDDHGEYVFYLYNDGTCKIPGNWGSGEWAVVNEERLKIVNFYGQTKFNNVIKSIQDNQLTLTWEGEDHVFTKMYESDVKATMSEKEYEEQLWGKWYSEDGNHEFTLYSDGTCSPLGNYGEGEWAVVNKNILKRTDFYGDVETERIKSLKGDTLVLVTYENKEWVLIRKR